MNTEIVKEIENLFRIKADIKSALISKGRSPNDDFTTYANEIRAIVCNGSGTDTPDVPDTPEDPVIPDEPTAINEYLERYNWLKADGSKIINAYRPITGSNTFKTKDVTIKAIIKVDSLTSNIGKTTAVCGASVAYTVDGVTVRYKFLNIVLYRIDETTFSVGYYGAVPVSESEYFGTYHLGDTLNIEGTEKTLVINGVTYNKTIVEDNTRNLSNVGVLQSAAVLGDKVYAGQIARFEYIANGVAYSSLVPTKVIKELPAELSYDGNAKAVGTIGMWDTKNEKFMTSSTDNGWTVNNYPLDGSDLEEPEVPDEPEEPQPEETLEYVDLYNYINVSKNAYIADIPYNSGSYNAEFETEVVVDNPIEGDYYSIVGCKTTIDGITKVVNSLQLVPINGDKSKFGVTYTVLNDTIPVDNPRGTFSLGESVHIKATNTKLTVNGVDYPITDGVDISKGFTQRLFYNDFNSSNSLRYKGRIKFFKAWNKGSLIADLYPAATIKDMPLEMCKGYKPSDWTTVPTGTIGMWNKVTNQLHTNNNRNAGTIEVV